MTTIRDVVQAKLERWVIFVFLALLATRLIACSTHRPSSAPSIKAVCKDGTMSACPRDSRLLFQVNGLSGKFFLSAYLESTESHEQSWLAPSAEDDPMPVAIHPGEQVLSRSVPLSILHKGTFKVRALITSEPVSRKDILAGKVAATVDTTSTLTVVRPSAAQ